MWGKASIAPEANSRSSRGPIISHRIYGRVMSSNCLIILHSYHHNNTRKVAETIALVLGAEVKDPEAIRPQEIGKYRLLGFGSGIYGEKHHISLLDLAEELPVNAQRRVFLFSTFGAPSGAMDTTGFGEECGSRTERYTHKVHTALREKLTVKGYTVVGEFACPGWNTNSFLRFVGGINKGRPNERDLEEAKEFAHRLYI